MTRVAWANDLHLNFLGGDENVRAFARETAATEADALLVAGDTGEAPDFERHLRALESAWGRPVWFVLGNHDYYQGSIASVRERARALSRSSVNLTWLPDEGAVELAPGTGLVGHDGWGDTRLGMFETSGVSLSDFFAIEDLFGLSARSRRLVLERLGDEAAEHFRTVLPDALDRYRRVVVLTHVPPWKEAAWHRGKPSDDDWLPFFSCKAVGDVLETSMRAWPDREMLVLCGHTHGGGVAKILPNLEVRTGEARYGFPRIQGVLEVD